MKNKKIVLAISLIITILGILFMYKNENLLDDNNMEWGYYLNNEKITNMPKFNKDDGIFFDHAKCNNDSSVEWDYERWGPIIKNMDKSNTKCSLYFVIKKAEMAGKDIIVTKSGDGLYEVEHTDLVEHDSKWNKTEYRYAGVDPDNYVEFNNEIWRIIGLVNAKVGDNVEQRVKIVRTDGVKDQKAFGKFKWDKNSNNWTTSILKDLLNGIYYESEKGDCFKGSQVVECDFSSGTDLPKGLDEIARSMIDKEVIWNLGGMDDIYSTAKEFYEGERGSYVHEGHPVEWSKETDIGEKYNGVGLMYPSDYGYATNGGSLGRNACLAKELYYWDEATYKNACVKTDWLYQNKDFGVYTISPWVTSSAIDWIFDISYTGSLVEIKMPTYSEYVWPVVYLTPSTKIVEGNGTLEEPFVLSGQN